MRDSTPVLLGAAAAGGLLAWLAHRAYETSDAKAAQPPSTGASSPTPQPASASATTNPVPSAPAQAPTPAIAADTSGLWIWPVAIADGHRPVVSDGFGSPRDGGKRKHAGVDLMFKRARRGELATVYRPDTPNGTDWYYMPDGTLALTAAAGRIWSAYHTPRGFQIVIDHGRFATMYQHLERMFVDERHDGPGGPSIDVAHPLGVIGGDPTNAPHLKHLHFELWLGRTPIDPEPFLRRWQLLEVHARDGAQLDVALRGQAGTTQDPALA